MFLFFFFTKTKKFFPIIFLLFIISFPSFLGDKLGECNIYNDVIYFRDEDQNNKKAICFANSFTSDNEGYCCYSNGKCYFYSEKPEEMNGLECPKENEKLKNTCGLAGRFPPINEGQCNGITLVEAFCCYVEVKGETACLRSKTKPKKKETTTEDIKKALSAYYNNNVPENYLVKCEAKKMKGILGKEMIFGFVLFIGSLIF